MFQRPRPMVMLRENSKLSFVIMTNSNSKLISAAINVTKIDLILNIRFHEKSHQCSIVRR